MLSVRTKSHSCVHCAFARFSWSIRCEVLWAVEEATKRYYTNAKISMLFAVCLCYISENFSHFSAEYICMKTYSSVRASQSEKKRKIFIISRFGLFSTILNVGQSEVRLPLGFAICFIIYICIWIRHFGFMCFSFWEISPSPVFLHFSSVRLCGFFIVSFWHKNGFHFNAVIIWSNLIVVYMYLSLNFYWIKTENADKWLLRDLNDYLCTSASFLSYLLWFYHRFMIFVAQHIILPSWVLIFFSSHSSCTKHILSSNLISGFYF